MRIVDVFHELYPPFNRQDINIHEDWIEAYGFEFYRKQIGEEAYWDWIDNFIEYLSTNPDAQQNLQTLKNHTSMLKMAENAMHAMVGNNMQVAKVMHQTLTDMLEDGDTDIGLVDLVGLYLTAVETVDREAEEGFDAWKREFDTFHEMTSSLEIGMHDQGDSEAVSP